MTAVRSRAEDAAWSAVAQRLGFGPDVAPPDDLWDPAPFGAVTGIAREAGRVQSRRAARARARAKGVVLGGLALGVAAATVCWAALPPSPVEASARAVLSSTTTASGYAAVEVLPEAAVLRVTLAATPDYGSYHEVWLVSADGRSAIPLGPLRGLSTALPLEAGTDLLRHPVVVVSAEPLDGDPGFSGAVLVRGGLGS